MKRLVIPFVSLLTAAGLGAAPAAWSAHPYVYPEKGQSKEKQDKDMWECHQWAVEQTGFDPTKPIEESVPHSSVVGGAAKGAAVGAVGGAIGGDAGKGAAIGALAGGLFSGMRNRRASEQQAATYQANTADYDRAYDVCLQGRGYTVG